MPKPKSPATQQVLLLDPFRVKPFADQPRKRFRGIAQLAKSIRLVGQVTPILVTPCQEKGFDVELVDGERRLQACRLGKMSVKALVQGGVSSAERFALSVAANFCRQRHDAMEVAEAIRALRNNGRSAHDIAGIFGKSLCWVYQHAYLLELCHEVQALLCRAATDEGNRQVRRPGRLTMQLALLLKPLSHPKQAEVANRIVNQKLSFGEARKHIIEVLGRSGQLKSSRAVEHSDPWRNFVNATVTYQSYVNRIERMSHATLSAMLARIASSQAGIVAGRLEDMADAMRMLSKTLRKGAGR